MDREFYSDFHVSSTRNAYRFVSTGRYGDIPKIVIFQPLDEPSYFNLFLGDYIGNKISDDQTITNNGDMPKVMATVIQIILHFTNRHPEAVIFISGSETTRKRLYARIAYTHYESLSEIFEICCADEYDLGYKDYQPSDKTYIPHAFLIRQKLN